MARGVVNPGPDRVINTMDKQNDAEAIIAAQQLLPAAGQPVTITGRETLKRRKGDPVEVPKELYRKYVRFIIQIAEPFAKKATELGDRSNLRKPDRLAPTIEEFVNAGWVGFMKAARRFDRNRGTKLSRYAWKYVRSHCHQLLAKYEKSKVYYPAELDAPVAPDGEDQDSEESKKRSGSTSAGAVAQELLRPDEALMRKEEAPFRKRTRKKLMADRAPTTLEELADLITHRAADDRRHEIEETRAIVWKIRRGREKIRRYLSSELPGKAAILTIIGTKRLGGTRGGRDWYERFLAAHRTGPAPSGVTPSEWEAISKAWAWRETERTLQGLMRGDLVVAEKVAFLMWRQGYYENLYKAEVPDGCPDLIVRCLPRGYEPKGGKTPTSRKGSPAPASLWGEEEETPVVWTPEDLATGVPRKIAGGNHFENTVHIPKVCAERLLEDYLRQTDELRAHTTLEFTKAVDPKTREIFTEGPWRQSGTALPKQETADLQADLLEAEATEAEQAGEQSHGTDDSATIEDWTEAEPEAGSEA
jgi:DNA-directed RNA polymerase specialized sigma subunit